MPLDVGPCAGTEAYINVIAVLLGFNWGLPDSDGCAEAQLERSGFTETLADLSATHLDVPSVAIRASCAVDDVNPPQHGPAARDDAAGEATVTTSDMGMGFRSWLA
jgi:hypothetical protein